jgi:adenylate cyclase
MRSSAGRGAALAAAFAEEERRGLQLATRLRLIALPLIAAWVAVENPFPEVLVYHAAIGIFALLGIAPLALWRRGVRAAWPRYLFPLLDICLLTWLAFGPIPFDEDAFPLPMRLRFGNEAYLFLILSVAVFTYSPQVVLWTGCAAAGVWSAVTWWILMQPDSLGILGEADLAGLSREAQMRIVLDPHRVFVGVWGRQVLVLLMISASLAAAVWRSRGLVRRQAEAERQRTNLSRYFSPNMVAQLAQADEPLSVTRTQDAAILFADLVGFTALSEGQPPDVVIGFLREFHRRMVEAVFAHHGTLVKYLGDGIMASFGTPRAGPHDATNAVRCARRMLGSIEDWNRERRARGEAPVRAGIGIHYGSVVMGDIGSEQHLEFAVVGDTVNVAARLEELTRELDAALLVSDAALAAARREGATAADLTGLAPLPARGLRGRAGALALWGGFAAG